MQHRRAPEGRACIVEVQQRRFAHAAVERGVDVIHGHSAHVVQAIER
jgi:poly-gamma-glutamate capsule biosynthesis protein CapA/YwtB (metallophosphatase superfamily)